MEAATIKQSHLLKGNERHSREEGMADGRDGRTGWQKCKRLKVKVLSKCELRVPTSVGQPKQQTPSK